MKLRISRREALRGIGAAALAAGLPTLTGCSLSDEEIGTRLAAAAAGVSDGALAPSAVAEAAPLARAEAIAALRRDAGPSLLWAVTSSGVTFRAFLARGSEADLREGRVRWVHGWLLTRTEIATANLAAG